MTAALDERVAEPDLDHPIVEIACRLLEPHPEEVWVFDEESAKFLARVLVSQKADPKLPAAVLGLFHVASELQLVHQAPRAAGRLFALLGDIGTSLFQEKNVSKELDGLLDKAREASQLLGSSRALPLEHNAAPPAGTVSARTMMRDPIRPKQPIKKPPPRR